MRVAFDIPADAKRLTKLEAGVLMAVAMFQPVTRGEISEMFGREISRDLIAVLREEGLIAAGPRSPKPGAPYTYVTTEKFLGEFGFEVAARPAGHRGAEGRGIDGGRRSSGGTRPCTRERRRRRQFAAAGRCAGSRGVAGQPRQGWVEGSNRASLASLFVKPLNPAYLNPPRSDRRGQIGDIPRPEGTGRQGRCVKNERNRRADPPRPFALTHRRRATSAPLPSDQLRRTVGARDSIPPSVRYSTLPSGTGRLEGTC